MLSTNIHPDDKIGAHPALLLTTTPSFRHHRESLRLK
jgi:hypothetical protein